MAEAKKKSGSTAKAKSSSKSNKSGKDSARAKELYEKKYMANRVRDEIWAMVILAIGIFFIVALQTQAAGEAGLILKNLMFGLFGGAAVILPYYLMMYGILLLFNKTTHLNQRSMILIFVVFLMFSVIYSGRYVEADKISFEYITIPAWYQSGVAETGGGVIGMLMSTVVIVWFGKTGLYIFAVLVILICTMLIINTPISKFIYDYKTKKAIKKQIAAEEAENEAAIMEAHEQELVEEAKIEYNKSRKEQLAKDALQSDRTYGEVEPLIKQAKESEKKKNIISYMIDEKLFGGHNNGSAENESAVSDISKASASEETSADTEEAVIKYGLEEIVPAKEGYGLDAGSIFKAPKEIEDKAEEAGIGSPSIFEKSEVKTALQTEKQSKSAQEKQESMPIVESLQASDAYKFPPPELLKNIKKQDVNSNAKNILQAKAEKLEQTLKDFKVDARVTEVTQGPAVTRYEIQPNTGVKVNSIVRLADDIALNLEAKSIRIEAPIPGKAAVGIEVENEKVNMVGIREIIESKEFREASSKISFAVGKDISGKPIVADLKAMPHMLIAGSTGSGKSVCINSIITSILYKAKPDEVKLMLIDPKVVELGNYNGIPHMLIPVVTEPSKAAAALNWAVAEMNDRYKKFAEVSVRDLAGYNSLMKDKNQNEQVLPQIVIIIDELADLMMAAPSQVEESICRLAQMARAAGMHLIVATQRPSVDVITGVIKANIPSRIAFAVSSQFDSRTILDMSGAEKLVGKGDMLFSPMGAGKPTRVQGNFISDGEVRDVIEYLKKADTKLEYSADAIDSIENTTGNKSLGNGSEEDELLPEAIEIVVQAEQASVSMLQRRFRIGYNRAARIIDMMEERGIVGPADGSRPRTVLMNVEELKNLKEGLISNEAPDESIGTE